MTTRAVHHLALGAQDVETVANFYREHFDLTEAARHHQGNALRSIWLNAGPMLLMIERSDASPREVHGVGHGPFLIAFTVAANERQRLEARLVQAGHAVEQRTAYSSYFRDPEGNRCAISHYPEPSALPAVVAGATAGDALSNGR